MAKAGGIAAEHLKSLIERIEKMEEERKAVAADIRDIYAEAKGAGFDVKTMRKVISLRKMDAADRDEQDAILAVYLHALGMEPGPSAASGEITDEVAEEVVDKRAVRAIEMLRDGLSIRKVAGETGMGHGTVQRLSKALARRQIGEVGGAVPGGSVPRSAGTPAAGTPEHNPETGEIDEPPAGASPNDATEHGQVAAALPPAAVPAGEPDEPTVSVSVHRAGEVLADSGPVPMAALKAAASAMDDFDPARDMPECLRRQKATVPA